MWPAYTRSGLLHRDNTKGASDLVGTVIDVKLPTAYYDERQYSCAIEAEQGDRAVTRCQPTRLPPQPRFCNYIPPEENDIVHETEYVSAHEQKLRRLTFDEWKPLIDDCTQFVTTEVMQTDDMLRQLAMVTYVYSKCKEEVDKFKSERRIPTHIHVIYKGGNVMRFVTDAFAAQQNDTVTRTLRETYGAFFKPSDMDFGIIPDEALPVETVHALSNRLFSMLQRVREEWRTIRDQQDPGIVDTFPYLRQTHEVQQAHLDKLRQTMVETAGGKDLPIKIMRVAVLHASSPRNFLLEPFHAASQRKDLKIVFADDEEITPSAQNGRWVCESGVESALYCSNNQSLKFVNAGDASGQVKHFDLVRMKLCFRIEGLRTDKVAKHLPESQRRFSKNLGGEVIDLSVQHVQESSTSRKVLEKVLCPGKWPVLVDLAGKDLSKHIYETYEFSFASNNLSYTSYSIPYLVVDLLRVLFHDNRLIWQDNKYVKRVGRIGGLLVCNGMAENKSWQSILDKLRTLKLNDTSRVPASDPFDVPSKVLDALKVQESIDIYDLCKLYFEYYCVDFADAETNENARAVVASWNTYIGKDIKIVEEILDGRGSPYKLTNI